MKFFYRIKKHKMELMIFASIAVFVGVVIASAGGEDGNSKARNSAPISEFQLADAQNAKPNRLQEARLADRRAQEAFSSQEEKFEDAPPPKKEPETKLSQILASNDDSLDRAKSLLGSKPVKEEEPKPSTMLKKIVHEPTPPSAQAAAPRETPPQATASTGRYSPTPEAQSLYGFGDPDVQSSLSSATVSTVVGASSPYARGSLLKLGSEYLAVIKDSIQLSSGQTDQVVIDVVGKLSPHTINQPFKLFATASLSSDGRRVTLDITHCIDPRAQTTSMQCRAIVKGLDGINGLSGEVYDPSMWASLVRTLGTFMSQFSLSSMTSSVTEAGVIMNQTQSNKIYEALAAAWQTVANDAATQIAAGGRTVTVTGGSVVKVLITEDSRLW